jgi:cobalt/nickel transport system permease protein
MAIFGAGAGGLLRNALLAGHATSARRTLATGLAAWVSIQLAALAVCLQLALNGQVAFSRVLPAMMGTHAWIGIGEAVLTLAVCAVAAGYPARSPARAGRGAATLCAAGLIALVLSPFASGSPDGLEWVAAKLAFLHEAVPVFAGPFVGYSVPAVASEALSTGLAGLIGVLASFTGAWLFLFVTRLGERQTVRI